MSTTKKIRPGSNRKLWPKQRERVTVSGWIVKALNEVGVNQAICIANNCRRGEHSDLPSPFWESVFQQLKANFRAISGRELPEMKAGKRYDVEFLYPRAA